MSLRLSSHIPRFSAGVLLLLSVSIGAQAPTVTLRDAWVREPMGGRTMTGAFGMVENTGPTPKAIVAASASISDKVELHEMKRGRHDADVTGKASRGARARHA
jgi:copper(I)-binding protein